jgi:hypothetical protein
MIRVRIDKSLLGWIVRSEDEWWIRGTYDAAKAKADEVRKMNEVVDEKRDGE